jgi:hypothetical protein
MSKIYKVIAENYEDSEEKYFSDKNKAIQFAVSISAYDIEEINVSEETEEQFNYKYLIKFEWRLTGNMLQYTKRDVCYFCHNVSDFLFKVIPGSFEGQYYIELLYFVEGKEMNLEKIKDIRKILYFKFGNNDSLIAYIRELIRKAYILSDKKNDVSFKDAFNVITDKLDYKHLFNIINKELKQFKNV